jgi:hypothetical protein
MFYCTTVVEMTFCHLMIKLALKEHTFTVCILVRSTQDNPCSTHRIKAPDSRPDPVITILGIA